MSKTAPDRSSSVGAKIRVVYIIGASHSGSTLLAMLLTRHPEVCTVGELNATRVRHLGHYLCSCGEVITNCAFWTGVWQEISLRGFPPDMTDAAYTLIGSGTSKYISWLLRPLHRGRVLERIRDAALSLSRTWRSQLPRIQDLNTMLAQCICERMGKKVIVDSSKIGLRLKYLLRNAWMDVKVMWLIRDGRGVVMKYTDPARLFSAGDSRLDTGVTKRDRESRRLAMAEAARQWRRSNEEAEVILRRLDRSRWVEVRYETLCTQPEATLRQLYAFIGVDPGQTTLNFRSPEHHIIGNRMRLGSTTEIRLDQRWKLVLDVDDLRVFEFVAGKMNRRFGYQ